MNGRAFKPTDWSDEGLPIIRIQNLNNHKAPFNRFSGTVDARFLVEDGELLFAWSGTPGTSFGAHIWDRGTAILNQHIFRVLDYEVLFDKPFLRYAINDRLGELIDLAHGGAGLAHVTKPKFEATELALPPLNEQRRIVAKLEALQLRSRRAREALAAVPPLLEKLRQSILAAAFRGDLTKDWRAQHKTVEPAGKLLERIRAERRQKWGESELAKMKARGKAPTDDKWKAKYVEPEAADATGLPELPRGWSWTSVPLLLSTARVGMRTGPFGSLLGREDYVASGIPIVGVENIGRMSFVRGSKQYISQSKADSLSEYAVARGDLLVSRSGTVGEVCVVPDDAGPGIISTNTIRIAVEGEAVLPFFLGYALIGASPVLAQIHTLCSGSTRDFLNQGIISALRVPLPSIAEQAETLARLRRSLQRCDEFEEELQATRTTLSVLERSVLAKAFRGELVPQDPSDEPADVTLARLRAASATREAPRNAQAANGARQRRRAVF